jgi:hypothetical protein
MLRLTPSRSPTHGQTCRSQQARLYRCWAYGVFLEFSPPLRTSPPVVGDFLIRLRSTERLRNGFSRWRMDLGGMGCMLSCLYGWETMGTPTVRLTFGFSVGFTGSVGALGGVLTTNTRSVPLRPMHTPSIVQPRRVGVLRLFKPSPTGRD